MEFKWTTQSSVLAKVALEELSKQPEVKPKDKLLVQQTQFSFLPTYGPFSHGRSHLFTPPDPELSLHI